MPNIQLYQGDCLELMKDIPDKSIDMILCDLPYGTTACKWDVVIPFDKLWEQYKRIIKTNGAIVLFGQEPFSSLLRTSNLDWYKYDIYWEKERLTNITQVKKRVGKTIETISVFYVKQPTYNPQMVKYEGKPVTNKVKNGCLGKLTDSQTKKVKEYIDTGWRYPTQVWKYQRDCLKSNLHPTQKPIALLENLIRTYTDEGDTVLDNCMGSGSTGVACINTNRYFIGMELDTNYFEIAKQRINGTIDISTNSNTFQYGKKRKLF
jgi:site-specific DNA-methyltransferase (adenine-specific)